MSVFPPAPQPHPGEVSATRSRTHTHTHTHMSVGPLADACIPTHTEKHTHTHTHGQTPAYTHMGACKPFSARTGECTHTRTHTCTCTLSQMYINHTTLTHSSPNTQSGELWKSQTLLGSIYGPPEERRADCSAALDTVHLSAGSSATQMLHSGQWPCRPEKSPAPPS